MKIEYPLLSSRLLELGQMLNWITFRVFLSLAILYLAFEANFEPIRAVYEKY